MIAVRRVVFAFVAFAVFVALALISVSVSADSATPTPSTGPPTLCHAPAPTTAAGYQRMFAALPSSQWGAADISISVVASDGRRVWLYGDTITQVGTTALDLSKPWQLVHSSAVVQRGGCLTVDGQQLIPDDSDDGAWYWIHDAHALSNDRIEIRAREIVKVGAGGVWGFADAGDWRTSTFELTPAGQLVLQAEGPEVAGAAPASGPFYPAIPDVPHHFGYGRVVQSIRLADGHLLVSTCQNDDDGAPHPWSWYRPYFTG